MEEVKPASKLPQYFAALSATFGAFSLGAAIGWNSPSSVTIQKNLQLQATDVAWVGSMMPIGAAAAMLPVPIMLNLFGRKLFMLMIVLPFVIGWLILAFVKTLPLYYLGRFITGFCGGSFCVAVPIFIGEIAQSDVRGQLGAFFELLLVTGVCFSYTVGTFTGITVLSLSCMVCIVIFGVIFFFIPETPYYCLMQGRPKEARKSLQWYRGKTYDIEKELEVIEKFITENKESQLSLRERLSQPAAKKSLIIGFGMICTQQLNGITAIVFHALEIFYESDTSLKPAYCEMAVGCVQLVATLFTTITIERAGRKVLLTISLSGMAICLVMLGTYYTFFDRHSPSVKGMAWVPVTVLCVDIAVFSLGVGPICWLMLGELFPTEIKNLACAMCACLSWTLAFVVCGSFPFMTTTIGHNFTLWIYAGMCCLAIVFVIFVCVETKGKTLQEIQLEMQGFKGQV